MKCPYSLLEMHIDRWEKTKMGRKAPLCTTL